MNIDLLNDHEIILILDFLSPDIDVRPWQTLECKLQDVLHVSHVCRRLRYLSTECCPNLWRSFALTAEARSAGLAWQQELIRRCNGFSMDGGWDFPLTSEGFVLIPTPHLSHLFEHAAQLRSLTLSIPSYPDYSQQRALNDLLEGFPRYPMPALKHLSLGTQTIAQYRRIPVLPSATFGANLPFLRTLRLRNVWLDLQGSNIGSRLERLDIDFYPVPKMDNLKTEPLPRFLNSWIDFLAPLNQLVILENFTIPFVPPRRATAFRDIPVILPRLEYINLDIAIWNLQPFIQAVKMPSCTSFTLRVEIPTSLHLDLAPIEEVIQLFSPRFRGGTYMVLGTCNSEGATVEIGNVPLPTSRQIRSSNITMHDRLPGLRITYYVRSIEPSVYRRLDRVFLSSWRSTYEDIETLIIAHGDDPTEPGQSRRNQLLNHARDTIIAGIGSKALTRIQCPRGTIKEVVGDTLKWDWSRRVESVEYPGNDIFTKD